MKRRGRIRSWVAHSPALLAAMATLGMRGAAWVFAPGLRGMSWVLLTAVVAQAGDRFDAARLEQMDDTIQRAISEHRLPGGVLWLERHGSNYCKDIDSEFSRPRGTLFPLRSYGQTDDTRSLRTSWFYPWDRWSCRRRRAAATICPLRLTGPEQ